MSGARAKAIVAGGAAAFSRERDWTAAIDANWSFPYARAEAFCR
jgi:hypothetical protein